MYQNKESCTCDKCSKACRFKPGWFKPGEAEKAAEYLGLNLADFFAKHLMVDWFEADGRDEIELDTFVLSPAIVGKKAGSEFPADPHGRCVFFLDGKCIIHTVKPFECREFLHTETSHEVKKRHLDVAKSWSSKKEQDLIRNLLGRNPVAEGWNDPSNNYTAQEKKNDFNF